MSDIDKARAELVEALADALTAVIGDAPGPYPPRVAEDVTVALDAYLYAREAKRTADVDESLTCAAQVPVREGDGRPHGHPMSITIEGPDLGRIVAHYVAHMSGWPAGTKATVIFTVAIPETGEPLVRAVVTRVEPDAPERETALEKQAARRT